MQESPGDLENPLVSRASNTMGIVSRRVVVTTGASTKGGGAVCEGRGVNGLWSATEAASHINVLELRTVALALRHFLPRLSGQHVLVRTDNTAALAYINRQGGVHSQSLHHWAPRLLLWAARHVLSLRAVHIPGHLNYGADLLSRGDPRTDWRRLVSTPSGDRPDLGAFVQGAGGPVCEQTEYLLPSLVLATGRQPPTRHRRAGPPVARS